jgi:hypothetical protein
MLYIAAGLLFLLASVSIYALIVSKKNYTLLFFLTPLILSSSIYTAYTVFALQGTPINGIPKHEIEILWVEMSKPDIFFTARNIDPENDDPQPRYYRVEYNDKNKNEMGKIQKKTKVGISVKGKLQEGNGGETKGEVEFVPMQSTAQPLKPQYLESQGVDTGIIRSITSPN